MSLFRKRKKINDDNNVSKEEKILNAALVEQEEDPKEKLHQTIFGIRFPWEAIFFVIVGFMSEVVDALLMRNTLDQLIGDAGSTSTIISAIVAAGCFVSMALAGFNLGNRRYYNKLGQGVAYSFWALAGVALVSARLVLALDPVSGKGEASGNITLAIVQFILYIGTGFMTRDGVRILTDNDLREYFLARARYGRLLMKLSEERRIVVEDISKLKVYSKYAERLVESKRSVKKNIAQYNEAARALIEAKMSIMVDPDLMEKMYDDAMKKEKQKQ